MDDGRRLPPPPARLHLRQLPLSRLSRRPSALHRRADRRQATGATGGVLDAAVSGNLFEHLVVTQIVHSAAAFDCDVRLGTFRTEHGVGVDVICELGRDLWAIEIKASTNVGVSDLRGLRAFGEFVGKRHRAAVFHLGVARRRIGGVEVLPWQEGLREMGF